MDIQAIDLFDMQPSQLDSFLAAGWFRMQQTIFTTDILHFNGEAYTPVWLRVRLQDFVMERKYISLQKKNSLFIIEIKKASITAAQEALYERYKKIISFDTAPDLHYLLYGRSTKDVYNTYMINLYDQNKLVATGFFDLGKYAAAGISCMYDPEYKNYSPGRYMIYKKIIFCKENNFKYFYPGYFVPGYPMFDYKLDIGKEALEYFNLHSKNWLPLL